MADDDLTPLSIARRIVTLADCWENACDEDKQACLRHDRGLPNVGTVREGKREAAALAGAELIARLLARAAAGDPLVKVDVEIDAEKLAGMMAQSLSAVLEAATQSFQARAEVIVGECRRKAEGGN